MDDVRCRGTEATLMDCPSSLSHSCGHHEDAGVRCTLETYGKQNNYKVYNRIKLPGPFPLILFLQAILWIRYSSLISACMQIFFYMGIEIRNYITLMYEGVHANTTTKQLKQECI